MLPLLWRLLTTKIAVAFSLWSNKRIHSSKSFSKARERITVSFGGGSNTAAAERIITRQSLGIAHWKGGMQQTSERALSAAQHHHLSATVARPRRKLVFLRLSLEGFQVSTFGRYWSESQGCASSYWTDDGMCAICRINKAADVSSSCQQDGFTTASLFFDHLLWGAPLLLLLRVAISWFFLLQWKLEMLHQRVCIINSNLCPSTPLLRSSRKLQISHSLCTGSLAALANKMM